jgi:hypothetical protein
VMERYISIRGSRKSIWIWPNAYVFAFGRRHPIHVCSAKDMHIRVGLLTSLRVRLAFGAPLEFAALSSEALRLPEASEGLMGLSGLLVMVEVMFIDEIGGCDCQCRACRSAMGGMASGVRVVVVVSRLARSDFECAFLTVIHQQKQINVHLSGSTSVSVVFLFRFPYQSEP